MYKIDSSTQYYNIVTDNGTTTIAIPTIKSRNGETMNQSEILTELCRAVIKIENDEVRVARSVYRVDSDNHTSIDVKVLPEYVEAVKHPVVRKRRWHIMKIQSNTAKRRDYISWDEYFMGIAMLSAMRSKDPNSQVGACIVRDNKILSLGYNGMPIGCDDDIMPWGREGNELETKYMYVCHSELNAILNAGKDLHGSTMYVTLFPCNECAKAIIQSGIKRIVYLDDKYRDANNNVAARHMFKIAGVKTKKYEPSTRNISLSL